jgi:hypothetical protein
MPFHARATRERFHLDGEERWRGAGMEYRIISVTRREILILVVLVIVFRFPEIRRGILVVIIAGF